jgi:hypothetical protein
MHRGGVTLRERNGRSFRRGRAEAAFKELVQGNAGEPTTGGAST